MREHYQKPDKAGGLLVKKATGLTVRELEVIQLVAEGQPNKQVAAELNIQHQDGGKTPPATDEQAEHSRHRRPHALRAIAQGIRIESSVQLTIVLIPASAAARGL